MTRIAICFSGGLRTFKLCYKTVVDTFKHLGQVDLFISTWEKPCYTQVKRFEDIYAINGDNKFNELLKKDDTITKEYLESITKFNVIDIEKMEVMDSIVELTKHMKWTELPPARLLCQYYKMARCNDLKNEYAEKNNINYDLTVRIRCDIKITSVPLLDKIQFDKIYVNSFVYVGNPTFRLKMINEMIYMANTENMNKICDIYKDFEKVWWINGYGEGVSYKHFEVNKLISKCILHNFKISVNRANGKIETM